MLNKDLALQVIKKDRPGYGPRYTYVFQCFNCSILITVRSDALKKATGLCQSCSHQKRSFESIYNSLLKDHRKTKVELTYEQYLDFTKENTCHYCNNSIRWIKYPVSNGKYDCRAYYLDRKDNNGSYSKDNCVVCCTKCNIARGNRYTYEEWYGMTEYFRKQIYD